VTTTAESTTSNQRPAREDRIAASTSGIGSPVAVRRQPLGSGIELAPVNAARSASSITCCVPTLRARSRPDLIQRRIVSGSRRARRAASGTVIMLQHTTTSPELRRRVDSQHHRRKQSKLDASG
jgi:hypothetical protein